MKNEKKILIKNQVYGKSLRRLYEESAEAKVVSFRALRNKITRGPAGRLFFLFIFFFFCTNALHAQKQNHLRPRRH